jgi:argininosuccinate lyase
MRFERERCLAAVDPSMLATDLADHLVRRGVPFREAHEMVGKLVRTAEERGVPLSELPAETFVEISETFVGADLAALFDPAQSIEARAVPGGTSSGSVAAQITALRALI